MPAGAASGGWGMEGILFSWVLRLDLGIVAGAQSKAYEIVVIEDIQLRVDDIRFLREEFYSFRGCVSTYF